jgi:hypothetical protein
MGAKFLKALRMNWMGALNRQFNDYLQVTVLVSCEDDRTSDTTITLFSSTDQTYMLSNLSPL